MTATRQPVPYRTQAAAREAVIKDALRVVPAQTRGWHDLTIQEHVALIRQYVEAREKAAKQRHRTLPAEPRPATWRV